MSIRIQQTIAGPDSLIFNTNGGGSLPIPYWAFHLDADAACSVYIESSVSDDNDVGGYVWLDLLGGPIVFAGAGTHVETLDNSFEHCRVRVVGAANVDVNASGSR